MQLVGHPRPVNPRSRLAAMAAAHDWPVLRPSGANGPRGLLTRPVRHRR
jgi:hypothetical protein